MIKVWEVEKVGSQREKNKREEGWGAETDIIKRKLVKVEDVEEVESKREKKQRKERMLTKV